jgi:hypothetical protein
MKKTLKDAVELLMKLGYPRVAVFSSGDTIHAIVFAESDLALRATLSNPEGWDMLEAKLK